MEIENGKLFYEMEVMRDNQYAQLFSMDFVFCVYKYKLR